MSSLESLCEDTMENLQTMCRSCNSRKGNKVDVVQGG